MDIVLRTAYFVFLVYAIRNTKYDHSPTNGFVIFSSPTVVSGP